MKLIKKKTRDENEFKKLNLENKRMIKNAVKQPIYKSQFEFQFVIKSNSISKKKTNIFKL